MLHVAAEAYHQMVAHCLDGFPEEACEAVGDHLVVGLGGHVEHGRPR
jgi:hypothetical protein